MNAYNKRMEGEKGLVSVIMPTYNRGYIIQRAIDSVKKQTYKKWELIIVDDGSTDDTEAIVKKNKEENIRYIAYSPNKGGNHARNIGMNAARGEYFSFLDTDCEWMPEFLQNRVCVIEKEKVDFVFGGVKRIEADNVFYFPDEPGTPNKNLRNKESILQEMILSNVIDTNTVLMRRKCFENNGGFDEKMHRLQDWEYFFRILGNKTISVVYEDNHLGKNYIQQDSISCRQDLYFGAHYYFLNKHKEIINQYNGMKRAICSAINMLIAFKINVKSEDVICLFNLIPDEQKGELFAEIFTMLETEHSMVCSLKTYADSLKTYADSLNIFIERDKRIKNLAGKGLLDKRYAEKLYKKIKDEGYKRIAIYGYGVLGKALYKDLQSLGAEISDVIDIYDNSDAVTCHHINEIGSADVLIVTAIYDYEDIRARILKYKNNLYVVSLEELI